MAYWYEFDRSSKKYICPNCGKKTFVRLVKIDNKELLPEEYGKCDRANKCNYSAFPPYRSNKNDLAYTIHKPIYKPVETARKTLVHLPPAVLEKTLTANHCDNSLLSGLKEYFNPETIEAARKLYSVGTIDTGEYCTACTFPFIDAVDNIRAIQVKTFENLHTVKTNWVHTLLEQAYRRNNIEIPQWLKDYADTANSKITCFFGSHLIKQYPNATICLVEAPKTALICTLFYGAPEDTGKLWIATGAKGFLTSERFAPLKGRKVVLYPDLGAYNDWVRLAIKALEKHKASVTVSNEIEDKASEQDRKDGLDIADFIIRDIKESRKEGTTPPPPASDWLQDILQEINSDREQKLATIANVVEIEYNASPLPLKTECLIPVERLLEHEPTPVNYDLKPLINYFASLSSLPQRIVVGDHCIGFNPKENIEDWITTRLEILTRDKGGYHAIWYDVLQRLRKELIRFFNKENPKDTRVVSQRFQKELKELHAKV